MILITRFIHILIGLFFIFCIGYLYHSAFAENLDFWTYFAFTAIFSEGVLLGLNKGKCPLSLIQENLGDRNGFFALFLPKQFIPFLIPVYFLMTTSALVLIYIKHF